MESAQGRQGRAIKPLTFALATAYGLVLIGAVAGN